MRNNIYIKGAVSVFLVIILVPCMLVSSLFVDLGRVHLSRSSSDTAADMALDSLLTNYDFDLKEWYGMAASCQEIDEFYEMSAGYFLRAIESKDLSDEEITTLSTYYAHATNNDKISDLVHAECLTDKTDIIKPVDNADLSNPKMMKKQIVEFMKYRGPIELLTGLIARLKKKAR